MSRARIAHALTLGLALVARALPAASSAQTVTLHGTVHDLKMCNQPGGHPDFECFGVTDKGIVQNTLGSDSLPVYQNNTPTTPTTTGKPNFDQWWRDVANVSMSIPKTITLSVQSPGPPPVYVFNDQDFFPVRSSSTPPSTTSAARCSRSAVTTTSGFSSTTSSRSTSAVCIRRNSRA